MKIVNPMSILPALIVMAFAFSCTPRPPEVKTGIWRGVIELQGQKLPFTFEIENTQGNYTVYLKNASEKLKLDEVSVSGDSIRMVLHIFDAELHARVMPDSLSGYYFKNYDKSFKQPFNAKFGDNFRFQPDNEVATTDFTGKYAVQFISDKKDTTVSVGVFTQEGNHAEGTFLTPSGDYRFLEGNVMNDKLYLSTFDGNHAFLFVASKNGDDQLTGDYWSGKSSHEIWTAVKNDQAKMPDAEALTYLKEGYEKIDFSFPDLDKNPVSPNNEKFRNKVLILQIFGTWCPNCMDETKFLSSWYNENKDRGVEILGLAYERKPDFDYARSRVIKMKEKLGVKYDFVIAGVNDKQKASETLPMLNRIMAFPTTIIIGKNGKVRYIRTGFEGPGTGIYYERFKERFNEMVNELLSENVASVKK